ncbi:Afadin- and alpha-actinin-binding protein [Geranomyces michiganensis]|nr:Afadin- and alpha-actinin-binding protein [Geranomyces michiganensis]
MAVGSLAMQKDVAFRDDLQYRLRRVSADNDNLAGTVARQKARLEQCEREIASLQNKNDTLQSSLKRETEKLSGAREELKTTKANLQYSKTQYNHDVRKRDRDFARLKDRMQRTVAEKTKTGMTLINPLAKPHPSTTTSNGKQRGSNNNDADVMYAVVMKNYEDRERELLGENQMLRDTLFETFRELKDRFADAGGHDPRDIELGGRPLMTSSPPQSRDEEHEEDPEAAMERAHFQLPFNLVQNTVQQRIRHVMMDLKAEWDELMDKLEGEQHAEAVVELEQRIAVLHNQNDEYQRIIEEQNRILESSLNGTAAAPRTAGHAAISEEVPAGPGWDSSIMDLAEQKAELAEKLRQLEIDRKNFTDAALRLGVERAALKREKTLFNDDRRKALGTDDFLKTLPETPGWLRARAKAEEPQHEIPPATPSRPTPANAPALADAHTDATPRPFNSTISTVQPAHNTHEHHSMEEHPAHRATGRRYDDDDNDPEHERKVSGSPPHHVDLIAHESDTLTQTPSAAHHWAPRRGREREYDDDHGHEFSEVEEGDEHVHGDGEHDEDEYHDDATIATIPLSLSTQHLQPQASSRSTSTTLTAGSTPSYIRSAMKKVERGLPSARPNTTTTARTAATPSRVRIAVGDEPQGRTLFRPGESDGKENAGPVAGTEQSAGAAPTTTTTATSKAASQRALPGEKKGFVATSTPNIPVGRKPPGFAAGGGAARIPAQRPLRPQTSTSAFSSTVPKKAAKAAK